MVLTNRHFNKHGYKQEETLVQERAFSSALKNGCDDEAINEFQFLSGLQLPYSTRDHSSWMGVI